MKRIHSPKRRDRKSGQSPYARHGKLPFEYSASYREWRNGFKRKVQRGLEQYAPEKGE